MELARLLTGQVRWLKVGMTLFYERGPQVVSELKAMGFSIFLDLKLHDIPHQVAGAAEVVGKLGVEMLTVHAGGGQDMIAAAVEGARIGAAFAQTDPPAVIAVSVLTSMDKAALRSVGVLDEVEDQVDRLAQLAHAGGANGVVCSPHEATRMRTLLGDDALVVTPGVRPSGSAAGDQSRVATPSWAVASGASHIVIGRPISQRPNPLVTVREILDEMEGVQGG
jgi:orotidine-5'-phosphate decarboxylase